MTDNKPGPARNPWCGILTAEKQASAPTQARTVRGPYTAFNLANSQRDRSGPTIAEGKIDGESPEEA